LFLQYSYTTGSNTLLTTYESYSLPTVNADRSSNSNYSILTSKNKVTIAQGGTGAGNAADARENLGVPPKNHASTTDTYGIGNTSTYGHVKLHATENCTTFTSDDGGITPAAAKKLINSFYATCSTAASTPEKTVSCTAFELTAGAKITIRFTNGNTASNPTLKVNSLAAKSIYYGNSAIPSGYLAANQTYTFVYTGSRFELIDDVDRVKQSETTTSNFRPILFGITNSTATDGLAESTIGQTYVSNKIYVKPSEGNIYATKFVGNVSGNATSADSAGCLTTSIAFTPAETALTPDNVYSLIGANGRIKRGTWNYAGNGYIAKGSDTTTQCPYGGIDLAGTTVIQAANNSTQYTQLFITPPTSSGTPNAITGEMIYYINNGSDYRPTWYRVLTDKNFNIYAPTLTGAGASGTWDINITGSATSATKATQDGNGNVITSKYVTLDTAQTISGAKTFTSKLLVKNTTEKPAAGVDLPILTAKYQNSGNGKEYTVDVISVIGVGEAGDTINNGFVRVGSISGNLALTAGESAKTFIAKKADSTSSEYDSGWINTESMYMITDGQIRMYVGCHNSDGTGTNVANFSNSAITFNKPLTVNGAITSTSTVTATKFIGVHSGNITGVTETNPTSDACYSPLFIATENAAAVATSNYIRRTNKDFNIRLKEGVAGTAGYSILELGNDIASTEAGNKYGAIRLFSNGTSYQTLRAYQYATNSSTEAATSRTAYIRDYGNTAYLAATTTRSQVGSTALPVYVSNSGVLTACTASSVFSVFSSSGNTLSITVAGQNRTANIVNSISNTWGNGTSSTGPSLTITVNGVTSTAARIPVATNELCGATKVWKADDCTAYSDDTYALSAAAVKKSFTLFDKYHTRAYSSGLKISTGTNVNDMYVPNATTSQAGVVTTAAQSFAGAKTFTGQIITSFKSSVATGSY
jgi:hypothetical protein